MCASSAYHCKLACRAQGNCIFIPRDKLVLFGLPARRWKVAGLRAWGPLCERLVRVHVPALYGFPRRAALRAARRRQGPASREGAGFGKCVQASANAGDDLWQLEVRCHDSAAHGVCCSHCRGKCVHPRQVPLFFLACLLPLQRFPARSQSFKAGPSIKAASSIKSEPVVT